MSFYINIASKSVPVNVPDHLSLTKEQLSGFTPFQQWSQTLNQQLEKHRGFQLNKLDIQSIDYFGSNKVGFVKFKSEVIHPNGKQLPGIVVLRGSSVAMLVVLRDTATDEKYAILTSQPRVAAGQLALYELPAGMVDDGEFKGAAAREIEEEVGLKISESELQQLNQKPVLISPGLLDETMSFFTCTRDMSSSEINELNGKLTGNPTENEAITLKIVRFDELKDYQQDAKLLIALSLMQSRSSSDNQMEG